MKHYKMFKRIPKVDGSEFTFFHDFDSVSEATAYAHRNFAKGVEIQIQNTRNNEIVKQCKLRK